jgi:ABC-type bacteriocin/lantibiotic exporter with double-glycine peptidase domain
MPKILPLKPLHSNGCGPLCIKMAVDYFALSYSLTYIDRITKCKKRGGITTEDLLKTLRDFDLNVIDKKNSSWRELKTLNTDKRLIIISWMLDGHIGHFSVLDHITSTHIYLADPQEGGILKIPKYKFLRLWFDYDEIWYPKKTSDIQLRRMAVVSK